MNLKNNQTADQQNNSLEPNVRDKKSLWLIIGIIVLAVVIILLAIFIFIKVKKTKEDPLSIIRHEENLRNMITIELDNNINVTLPQSYALYAGWKEKINLTFKNNSPAEQSVDIKFNAPPSTYLEDKTISYDNQDQIIELFSVGLNPNETATIKLSVQTLKVWDTYFTLYLNEKSQKINLDVIIKEKTPVFGTQARECAKDQPFITYFGPDCGEGVCDGLSADVRCVKAAKESDVNTCRPYKYEFDSSQEDEIIEECQQSFKFISQITRDSPIYWSGNMITENSYAWEKSDWYLKTLARVNAQQSIVSDIINGGDSGWTETCSGCTNPDGSVGFYDIDNKYLTGKFRQYVYDLSKRYKENLNYIEMANEPANEFYLCGCGVNYGGFLSTPPDAPLCTATAGPNQRACIGGEKVYQQEFVDAYGDFLAGTVKIASEEIKKNNPQALIITGAIDNQELGLSVTTEYMVNQGILKNNNVAIGIHQIPYLGQQYWSSQKLNCKYYQKPGDPWWLPEECEKAPPFTGIVRANTTVSPQKSWSLMDQRYDNSMLLKDAEDLGVLDKIYFFDSEHHTGFNNITPKYDLTEAISGIRQGVINSHQKYLGTLFVGMKDNDFSAKAYNLMVKTLTGVTSVYKWESKLIDSDYSGVVYKLFTRGQEDILVFWNNDNSAKNVTLKADNPLSKLNDFEVISFDADRGANNFIEIGKPNSLPAQFTLKSIKEIKILSVIRNKGEKPFNWLLGIDY